MKHIKTINKPVPERKCFQGRLRRVPGFLPVGLQNFLYRCQSEVREVK